MERGAGAVSATPITLRLARSNDVPSLEALIGLSAGAVQAATYSPAQIESALGTVFGVDRQLIADETYFVAEGDSEMVGCGGWSSSQPSPASPCTRRLCFRLSLQGAESAPKRGAFARAHPSP